MKVFSWQQKAPVLFFQAAYFIGHEQELFISGTKPSSHLVDAEVFKLGGGDQKFDFHSRASTITNAYL